MKKWILVLLAFAGASCLSAQGDATKTPKDFTCELLPRALRGSFSCAIPPNPFEGVLGDPPCSLGWTYDCLAWEPQPYVRFLVPVGKEQKTDDSVMTGWHFAPQDESTNIFFVQDTNERILTCHFEDNKISGCALKNGHSLDEVVQVWVDQNKIHEAARKADERGCQQAINTVLKILAPRPIHTKSKKEQP